MFHVAQAREESCPQAGAADRFFGRMAIPRALFAFALVGSLLAPLARAGEIYSYEDTDGVIHFTNAPSDSRYHRVRGRMIQGGVYRVDAAGRERPVAQTGSETLERWREHIKAAATKYQLPEALLMAVMAVESNFDPRAISVKGAVGLMQLMPSTAHDMYVADAWAPEQNIEGGARYLRILANQYGGDLLKTLAAYNAGPDAVRRAGDAVPDIPETREYVRKVIASTSPSGRGGDSWISPAKRQHRSSGRTRNSSFTSTRARTCCRAATPMEHGWLSSGRSSCVRATSTCWGFWARPATVRRATTRPSPLGSGW